MKQFVIIGVILLIALVFTLGCISERSSIVVSEPLCSLDRSNTASGQFLLGSGMIENKPYYSYYIQTDDGGYKLMSVDASLCTIYKDEDNKPFIVAGYKSTSYELYSDTEKGHAGEELIFRKYGSDLIYRSYSLDSDVEIHIPRNSTIGGYNP